MNLSGALRLRARWAGGRIEAVSVDNRRARAASLLCGRDGTELAERVPRLFSVCAQAQAAAAGAAWRAAGGEEVPVAAGGTPVDIAVLLETTQEHLWRLLVDWPLLLGHEPDRAGAVEAHRRVATAMRGAGADLPVLGRALREGPLAQLLGEGVAAVEDSLGGCGTGGLDSNRLPGLAGRLLADLARIETCAPLLPPPLRFAAELPAAQCLGHLPWPWSDSVCAEPEWDQAPAETGALARRIGHPLVHELVASGRVLSARLLARLLELVEGVRRLAGTAPLPAPVDAFAVPAGGGLARVGTARGVLLHWLRIEHGRVADYAIVAPTEWNFHPRGVLARQVLGARAEDAAAARRYLEAVILSLDPCVEHEIELDHA